MAFLLMILSIVLIAVVILLGFIFLFSCVLPVLRGAPFVPTHKERVEKAIKLIGLGPNQKIIDLGSGDGRVLIAAAKKGAKSYGSEINPLLVWRTKFKIKKEGLQSVAFCNWKSFWSQDLSSFDVVFVYGISHIMKWLERKLQRELKPGAKVVSFVFSFPSWQPSSAEDGIFIYQR